MANPGSWKEVDTNKWKNSQTGDTIRIDKKRSVAGDPSTRSWKIYLNDRRVHDMRDNVGKERAVKKAKSLMANNTASKQMKRKKDERMKKKIVREAYQVAQERSDRARSIDRSQSAKRSLDPGDIDDLRKWKNNPGQYDLIGIDTKGATGTLEDIYPPWVG